MGMSFIILFFKQLLFSVNNNIIIVNELFEMLTYTLTKAKVWKWYGIVWAISDP